MDTRRPTGVGLERSAAAYAGSDWQSAVAGPSDVVGLRRFRRCGRLRVCLAVTCLRLGGAVTQCEL
jgi:hypothetical protein